MKHWDIVGYAIHGELVCLDCALHLPECSECSERDAYGMCASNCTGYGPHPVFAGSAEPGDMCGACFAMLSDDDGDGGGDDGDDGDDDDGDGDGDNCQSRGVCSRHECDCTCGACDARGVHARSHCVDAGAGNCECQGELGSDAERETGVSAQDWPALDSPDAWPEHVLRCADGT